MATICVAVLLASWVGAVIAQVDQRLVTWASVSVIYHGEKMPVLSDGLDGALTPLGAKQAYDAGSFLRGRYLNGTTGSVVRGMSTSEIDNSQLEVLSMDDGYVSASAMAFMQGLYPPTPGIGEETVDAMTGMSIQSPSSRLNGYQYPALSLVSTLDLNYIWVAGNVECTRYSIAKTQSFISEDYQDDVLATRSFYNNMSQSVFGGILRSTVNYRNALDLYEYALFEHNHNTSLYIAPTDLGRLESLASQQQWEINTPSSTSSIGAIAGRTLASKVMQMFKHNIDSFGLSNRMTLLFSSHEPFLSFFSLASLSTGPSAGKFDLLPAHGSFMTFELFSYSADPVNSTVAPPYPGLDDLWVQFLYRNGSDDLISYPLFRRGVSEVAMKWKDFVAGMGAFSLADIGEWCTSCQSINFFCEAINDNTAIGNSTVCLSDPASVSRTNKTLSPIVAGVIGATVTIATFIIIAAILVLCGFRMNYRSRSKNSGGGDVGVLKRSGSGGFKGAEKLASDTDLRLKGNGGVGASVVRHERVGSWELNESPVSPGARSSMDRVVSRADYGRRSEDLDRVDPFAHPVMPVERV